MPARVVSGVEEWWLAGERVPVGLHGTERMIWMRRVGSGRCMTLLHGYPSSSHDWAKVLPRSLGQVTIIGRSSAI